MNYTIKVYYGADDSDPQVHSGLEVERAWEAAEAFSRDLFTLDGEGVSRLTVEAELPKPPPCTAELHHGPGHQSTTRCELTGAHEVHEGHYHGGIRATWRGQTATTGYFDEPPQEED